MRSQATPSGTLSFDYHLDGARKTLSYPGAGDVTYTYTPGGRMWTVTDWGGRRTTYSYRPMGLVSSVAYPNGMVATYDYDVLGRLTFIKNAIGATTVSQQAYALDNEGNRRALDEYVYSITPTGVDHFDYAYDGLSRLRGSSGAVIETFTPDAASNIAVRTGPAATYRYDGADRIQDDGGSTTWQWSPADRISYRGADAFTFDAVDRMKTSTVGGVSRSYAYDGDGLLASRSDGASPVVWDASSSPRRLLQAGAARLVYGSGPLYAVEADGSTTTFARDGTKSVRAEVTTSGVVTRAFRYLAYGAITRSVGGTPSYLGYAGHLTDPSGLLFMHARWYDPAVARFMTADPVGGDVSAPVSMNPYSYANLNPLLVTDPMGSCAGWLAIVCAIAASVGPLLSRIGPAVGSLVSKAASRGAAATNVVEEAVEDAAAVASRITIGEKAWAHVLEGHFRGGARTAGNSIFTVGEDVVRDLVTNAGSVTATQKGGRLIRVFNTGTTVGVDKNSGNSATNIITVITDLAGNLITTHPGAP